MCAASSLQRTRATGLSIAFARALRGAKPYLPVNENNCSETREHERCRALLRAFLCGRTFVELSQGERGGEKLEADIIDLSSFAIAELMRLGRAVEKKYLNRVSFVLGRCHFVRSLPSSSFFVQNTLGEPLSVLTPSNPFGKIVNLRVHDYLRAIQAANLFRTFH